MATTAIECASAILPARTVQLAGQPRAFLTKASLSSTPPVSDPTSFKSKPFTFLPIILLKLKH